MPLVKNIGTALSGQAGGGSQSVWYFGSNVAGSTYATSGVPYTPLAKNATEQYVTWDAVAPASGNFDLTLIYAMSVANSGDVVLELDYARISDGSDPNGSLTTQSSFTFTPGSATTRKSVGPATQSTLRITVAGGDHLMFKLTRKNSGSDTHTGTLNLEAVRMVA